MRNAVRKRASSAVAHFWYRLSHACRTVCYCRLRLGILIRMLCNDAEGAWYLGLLERDVAEASIVRD